MPDREASFLFRFDSGLEAKKTVGKGKGRNSFPRRRTASDLASWGSPWAERGTEEPPRGALASALENNLERLSETLTSIKSRVGGLRMVRVARATDTGRCWSAEGRLPALPFGSVVSSSHPGLRYVCPLPYMPRGAAPCLPSPPPAQWAQGGGRRSSPASCLCSPGYAIVVFL